MAGPIAAAGTATRFTRKHVDATRTYGFDFSRRLGDGVTLTGSPSVSVSPAGLGFADEQVNAAEFFAPSGASIQPGEGVLVQLSGGTEGADYRLKVACGISSGGTVAETFIVSIYEDEFDACTC